jgi:lysylphosphatidylglycerol synthetase-like protein (DUF2156 family)
MGLDVNLSHDKYVVASLVPLVVMLVTMLVGGTTAQVAFSYAAITFIALYVLMGTHSSGDRHSQRPFLALVAGLLVILGVAFALLWYYHFQDPTYADPTYWLGFPRATAVVVYLLWMPPALYLMFSYPYLFERYIWNEEQAEEFREMNRVSATGDAGGDEE